tara:strand:- start:1406 stop:1825 length:420 start_codon:yes stop_codon:yes gene_type:complete
LARHYSKLPDLVRKLIDDKNIAHFATLKKDGNPHITPVWIDRQEDIILVNTTRKRLKTRNAQKDKRVALSITDQTNATSTGQYTWVSIIGEVIEITDDNAETHRDQLTKKYINQPEFPWKDPKDPPTIIKIKPIIIRHS